TQYLLAAADCHSAAQLMLRVLPVQPSPKIQTSYCPVCRFSQSNSWEQFIGPHASAVNPTRGPDNAERYHTPSWQRRCCAAPAAVDKSRWRKLSTIYLNRIVIYSKYDKRELKALTSIIK